MDGSEDEKEIRESLEPFPVTTEEFFTEFIGSDREDDPNVHPDHPPSEEGIEIVILWWEESSHEWDFRREEKSDPMEQDENSGDNPDFLPESDQFSEDPESWEYIRQWTTKYDE